MINNFGGIIKLNRIQQGLTLDYISYKTGISKSQISRIERNKEQITFENVVKIFSVMNIEVSNENFETQFEKDFQTFYSDVVYVKDIENSYKVIRSYSDKIKSSLSYIKYLLCELIYMVMKGRLRLIYLLKNTLSILSLIKFNCFMIILELFHMEINYIKKVIIIIIKRFRIGVMIILMQWFIFIEVFH